jgi:hypothetical protein
MRENRMYGSEGGETGKPVFPTPIEDGPYLGNHHKKYGVGPLTGVSLVIQGETGDK